MTSRSKGAQVTTVEAQQILQPAVSRMQPCVAWAHMAAAVTTSSNYTQRFGTSAIKEKYNVIMMVMC